MDRKVVDWRRLWARNERIAAQALRENLRRLIWLSMLLVPLSLVHVASSWNDHPLADATSALALTRWREAVVVVHLGFAANLALVAGLIWWVRRQTTTQRGLLEVLEVWGLASALGFTIVIAGIDQWVGSSITSFLIGCVLVGALFLLRPQRAATMYVLAFLAYAWALGLTQADALQLAHSRIDGFIACSLGFMVSLMIWRKHVIKETLIVELQASRQALHERSAEIQAQAVRDPLTQVWNRAEILRLTQRELMRAQRHGGETCLVMVDIDGLRQVNERWGHGVGDRVLVALANRLVEALRATDEVGRLGSEEFAVLLPQTGAEEARLLAERLQQSLARLRLPVDGGELALSASLAVAAQPGRALVPVPQQCDRLYAQCEQALALAKAQGRRGVVVTPPPTPH